MREKERKVKKVHEGKFAPPSLSLDIYENGKLYTTFRNNGVTNVVGKHIKLGVNLKHFVNNPNTNHTFLKRIR